LHLLLHHLTAYAVLLGQSGLWYGLQSSKLRPRVVGILRISRRRLIAETVVVSSIANIRSVLRMLAKLIFPFVGEEAP
jgi:hypothetical protein